MKMDESAVRQQSLSALKQWDKQWTEQAATHAKYKMKSMEQFRNYGIGKACLIVANGYSFEENIETIKKHQDNVDILACDKTMAHCINNGVTPDFVLVCDANVNYEKYMEPVKDKLQDTVLFINVCANPQWTANGNWKDIYFFVNMDVLGSERKFQAISGCPNVIAAGTNVSNAQVILLTQCTNDRRDNFFGYDKLLLIGFDYSWDDNKYYAFDGDGGGKQHYMKHSYCFNLAGDFVYSSTNLTFSSRWLDRYIKGFKIQAVQCSKRSIQGGIARGDLAEQMQYRYKPEHREEVADLVSRRLALTAKIDELNACLFNIDRDHVKQVMRTI